ncbi:MAG: ATP-binding cassette domain-containing protein [Longimicrobiales bacterium]
MGDRATLLEARVRLPLDALQLDVSLSTPSAAVAIVGPSGAGKSAFLRVLAGVERRAKGIVLFRGETWQDSESGVWRPPWERGVGWVPQDDLLFPHLSVRENLGYAGGSAVSVEEMAGQLSVDHLLDRRPRYLSGGERQRVALGRALLSSPRLLLLDEPFSALDRPLRREVVEQVSALARERAIPLVLVSHDETDADLMAEERWVLSDGVLRKPAAA